MTNPLNVLMVVVDCLAWVPFERELDAGNLPALSRLVEHGTLFREAITTSTYTTPAFASLLTGLYPPRHRVMSLRGDKLHPGCPDFIGFLNQSGYRTEAWVTGPLHPALGLSRSWDEYDYRDHTDHLLGRDHRYVDWLGANAHGGPWFVLLHLWEMHHPRQVLAGIPAGGPLEPLYYRSLRSTDALIGRLAEVLDPERTVLAVLGDHGENINWFDYPTMAGKAVHSMRTILRGRPVRFLRNAHGIHVYEDLIRIPWIMSGGGAELRIVNRPVSLIDVMPTIMDVLGLPSLEGEVDGESALCDVPRERALAVFSRPLKKWPLIDCVRRPPWKLVRIHRRRSGRDEYRLHNYVEDPLERMDYGKRYPDVVDALRKELASCLRRGVPSSPSTSAGTDQRAWRTTERRREGAR